MRAHFYEFSEEKVKRGDREILAQDSLRPDQQQPQHVYKYTTIKGGYGAVHFAYNGAIQV